MSGGLLVGRLGVFLLHPERHDIASVPGRRFLTPVTRRKVGADANHASRVFNRRQCGYVFAQHGLFIKHGRRDRKVVLFGTMLKIAGRRLQ